MSQSDDTLLLANVSRRGLLKGLAGASALLLAARWDIGLANEQAQFGAGAMPGGWVDNPNVFIHIDANGLVTIVNNRAEMGQGIRTSLVMVAADELGADWDRVRAEQADGDQDKLFRQRVMRCAMATRIPMVPAACVTGTTPCAVRPLLPG